MLDKLLSGFMANGRAWKVVGAGDSLRRIHPYPGLRGKSLMHVYVWISRVYFLCCCCCCCCCSVASVMSDFMQSHRWQPTRLCRPWDSPGKNTEVGCHFLLQCMKVKSESEVAQSCPTLSDPMDCSPPGSSVHGIFQARVLEWGAIAFSIISFRTS